MIVAISGAIQAWRQTDGLDSVFDTTYGRLLLTKIGLVVMIVAAASVSRHIVRLWADRKLIPAGPGALAGRGRSRGRARAAQRGGGRGGDRGDRAARDRTSS